jgi:hypothetical protein
MLTSKNVYQCIWASGGRRLFLSFGVLLLTAGIVGSLIFKSPRRAFAASAMRLGFVVTNTNDQGAGSLRQALLDANANTGADTITFDIPHSGVQIISPTSLLPTITDPVVIDATTQPGYAGTPLIELDGSNISGGSSGGGLHITCGDSVVRGLAVNRFSATGILLETRGNNRIEGNFIGLDPTGTIARGNQGTGIVINNSANLIGGTTPQARNVISGNRYGIFINRQSRTDPAGNVVQGNLIGTNASGTAPLPNTSGGIVLGNSSGNTIGGSAAGAANIIAFNGGAGVEIFRTRFQIAEKSINNAIKRNRIFSNAGLGIAFSPNRLTPGEVNSGDPGPNRLQNFPLITAVTRGAQSTSIVGTLNSQSNTVFAIEVFSNSACDESGNGEGAQFFHTFEATTDATGAATFNANAPLPLPVGRILTMTATDSAGNTSEFSPCQAGETRGSVELGEFAYRMLEDVGQAKITVFRVGGSLGEIKVGYSTADQTATGGVDYTGISGTLTFADGEMSKTLLIPIFEDGAVEPEERATLTLTTADEPETLGGKTVAVLSIFDSNTPLTLSVNSHNFVEGDTGKKNAPIKVILSAATARTVTVDFITHGLTTSVTESDFQFAGGTLTFAPGTFSLPANVNINGDILDEPDETFELILSNPKNATIFRNNGLITIVDDDDVPFVSIGDVRLLEGNSGFRDAVFNVTLSVPSERLISVVGVPVDGTATAETDFTPFEQFNNGRVEFRPGETSKTLIVRVLGDTTAEADENFFINLRDAFNTKLKDAQGIGTILDDDSSPGLLTISGRVKDGLGNGVGDVTITLSGSQSVTAQTDANGQFFLRSLTAGGSYLVTPSKAGRVFEPSQLRFDGLSADAGGADFISVSEPATLQFSAANFTSEEGAGHATLSVKRQGNTSGTVTVEFSTTTDDPAALPCDPTLKQPDGTSYPQGTAYARCDYVTTIDTLTFAPGETTKEIHVPLVDDVHVEGDESVQVRLQNVTGAATLVEAQGSATLSITDNDTTAGQPNPIFSTSFFVRMHYLDFLSREPEVGEPWSSILNNCANPFNLDPQNSSAACDRLTVSQSFFGSPEFRLKGFYAYTFYRVAFGRRPEYAEIIPDTSRLAGATASEVYARRAALAVNFTSRAEFKARFDALTNTAFVHALLDHYGVQQITTPDPQQPEASTRVVLTYADLINRLGATGAQALTRAQVLRAIVESTEVGAIEYKGAFVAMQYYSYLRRTPEDAGYQAWLRVINQDPNNVRIMVNGFVNSTEYRLRFGHP